MKRVVVLGSTGSIGQQTLDVIRANPDDFAVVGLAAGKDARALAAQIAEFKPQAASCIDGSVANFVDGATRILSGDDGIVQLVEAVEADVTVVGTPGMVGARATVAALQRGQNVALANKETLVMAGDLVMREAATHGATVLPTDSEHSAIWQCLRGEDAATIRRIILAASGGPFRKASEQELVEVTPEQALQHPTWSMGAKITIDSATLLNKGLEIIEAHWLFALPYTKIEVVIHPQSIVHAPGRVCRWRGQGAVESPRHALANSVRFELSRPAADALGRSGLCASTGAGILRAGERTVSLPRARPPSGGIRRHCAYGALRSR